MRKYNDEGSTRRFSEIKTSSNLMKRLAVSSRSTIDLNSRLEAHTKAFSNLDGLMSTSTRSFAGTAGLNSLAGLQPQQYVDVTVAAMIKSIAGFFTIERGLDAPRAMLPFVNLVTTNESMTVDGFRENPAELVSRNIGPDFDPLTGRSPIRSAQNVVTFPVTADATTISYLDTTAKGSFVPCSLKIHVSAGTKKFTLTDNGKGEILAPAGTGVTGGSINYKNGLIKVEFATGSKLVDGDSYTLDVAYDTPRTPINRVKGDLDYYELTTYPQSILAESNMIANLVAQKSMGINMNEVLKKKVMEEYVKMINRSVVEAIVNNVQGAPVKVDLSGYSIKHNGYESYLHLFTHGLTQVNSELTSKSWKSVETSAYLVGIRVAEIFKACTIINTFVPNKDAAYIEDLVGYYNGIPVVQSFRVDPYTGYAIHKTSDGLMAPLARGIFLPVNDLPEVGNFNNPTQTASGIFSYEGIKFLTSELIQEFVVTLPEGLDTIAATPASGTGWAAITK